VKVCLDIPDLVKIGQEYRPLHVKTYVRFVVAGDIR